MSEDAETTCCPPTPQLTKTELDAIAQFLSRAPLQGTEAFTYCQLVARIDLLRRG